MRVQTWEARDFSRVRFTHKIAKLFKLSIEDAFVFEEKQCYE